MTPLSVDLNDLYFFAQVVHHHGFTAISHALDIPKSRISRRVSQLEANLGACLLQRTSKWLSLTDAGQEFYMHCQAMVAEVHAGTQSVQKRPSEPSSVVRVSLPIAITNIVFANLLPRFIQRYPKVQFKLQVSSRAVDLIEENFDILMRGVRAEQQSSSLVQVKLCTATNPSS